MAKAMGRKNVSGGKSTKVAPTAKPSPSKHGSARAGFKSGTKAWGKM